MNTIIRYIASAITAIFICIPVQAQIRYDEQTGIQIGDAEIDKDYSINMRDIHKMVFMGPENGSIFEVDCYHTFTYFTAYTMTIYFYEPDTSSYQDVRAYDIRLRANGEIYDSYTEPEDALEVLRRLRPVSYSFKNEAVKAKSTQGETPETHFGFIAQEVKEILPDDVNEDSDGNLSIRYNTFIPIAINSVKALSDKISRNEERLAELEKSLMK